MIVSKVTDLMVPVFSKAIFKINNIICTHQYIMYISFIATLSNIWNYLKFVYFIFLWKRWSSLILEKTLNQGLFGFLSRRCRRWHSPLRKAHPPCAKDIVLAPYFDKVVWNCFLSIVAILMEVCKDVVPTSYTCGWMAQAMEQHPWPCLWMNGHAWAMTMFHFFS